VEERELDAEEREFRRQHLDYLCERDRGGGVDMSTDSAYEGSPGGGSGYGGASGSVLCGEYVVPVP
jgi:hypothetical protein